jgi:hypothetical protein
MLEPHVICLWTFLFPPTIDLHNWGLSYCLFSYHTETWYMPCCMKLPCHMFQRTCYPVNTLGGFLSNCQINMSYVCALLHCCRAKLDFQICGLSCDFSPNTHIIGACNIASSCLVICLRELLTLGTPWVVSCPTVRATRHLFVDVSVPTNN